MTEAVTTIENRTGIHARPALIFVQKASTFQSKIMIRAKGKLIDATSILMITSMGLVKGTEVTIIAEGPDEADAVAQLKAIIDSRFGEGYIADEPVAAAECNDRGVDCIKAGDYRQAIKYFNKAVELEPEFALAYNNRGWTHMLSGDYDKALDDCNTAIQLVADMNAANFYDSRGNVHLRMENYREALEDFNEIIRRYESYVSNAYLYRGIIHSESGDYKQALEDFDKASALGVDNAYFYLKRGETYFGLNDYQRAMADFDKAVELDPNNAAAYKNRGLCHKALGEAKAQADFNKAKELGYIDAQKIF